MYSKVYSGMTCGIDGMIITVEADISPGLPGLNLVGYLSSSVKEAGNRVRTALKNVGKPLPPRKVTVNLSPADIRKDGNGYDLSIAVAILSAMGEVPDFGSKVMKDTVYLGELSLDGRILPTAGVLPIADYAKQQGFSRVICSPQNAEEASLVNGVDVIPVADLGELMSILSADGDIDAVYGYRRREIPSANDTETDFDMADIRGQETMKRGMIIAAAGFHNILLTGAAGSGKSMMAKCLPGILPGLSYEEQMEITKIYSVAGLLVGSGGLITKRPFRAPHHTVSAAAVMGGGSNPRPGEVSLASGGVLFLDEFPEFSRSVIESLRQPLEDRAVTVSRVKASYTYPAKFMLVAARNNCPCGCYPDRKRCKCTEMQIQQYTGKISGPIMDRIDIRIDVRPVGYDDMFSDSDSGITSADARKIVEKARLIQMRRYQSESFGFNSQLPQNKVREYIRLGSEEERIMKESYSRDNLSARGYFRILRLARTIADIEGRNTVSADDIREALFFRNVGE